MEEREANSLPQEGELNQGEQGITPTGESISGKETKKDAFRQILSQFRYESRETDGADNPLVITFSEEEIEQILTNPRALTFDSEKYEENLLPNFAANIVNLGLTATDWKVVVIKSPQLLGQSSEKNKKNVRESAEKLGLKEEEFIKAARRLPSLFSQRPKTIAKRIHGSAKKLNLEEREFVEAALVQPSLFAQSSKTINKNVGSSARQLGIVKGQFIKAALKMPQLFHQSPETINTNTKRSAEKLGVTKEQFVAAALKQPQLFYQSPETIDGNAEGSAEKLGVTKEQFVAAALKYPSLFALSPISVYGKFNVLEIMYGGNERAKEEFLAEPNIINYSKARDLMHYFARQITGGRQNLIRNPESIIEKYFDPEGDSAAGRAKAREVIAAIKEMYGDYTEREKNQAKGIRKERERRQTR